MIVADNIILVFLGCPTWQLAGEERTTALGCPVIVIDNIILVLRLSYLAASWGGKDNGFGLSCACC